MGNPKWNPKNEPWRNPKDTQNNILEKPEARMNFWSINMSQIPYKIRRWGAKSIANTLQNGRWTCHNVANTMQNARF